MERNHKFRQGNQKSNLRILAWLGYLRGRKFVGDDLYKAEKQRRWPSKQNHTTISSCRCERHGFCNPTKEEYRKKSRSCGRDNLTPFVQRPGKGHMKEGQGVGTMSSAVRREREEAE